MSWKEINWLIDWLIVQKVNINDTVWFVVIFCCSVLLCQKIACYEFAHHVVNLFGDKWVVTYRLTIGSQFTISSPQSWTWVAEGNNRHADKYEDLDGHKRCRMELNLIIKLIPTGKMEEPNAVWQHPLTPLHNTTCIIRTLRLNPNDFFIFLSAYVNSHINPWKILPKIN